MENTATDFWRKCSTCKKPISYGAKYYVCSVSTCNGQRTGYAFCELGCFESHVPGARHRDAGGIAKTAPANAQVAAAAEGGSAGEKREPVRKIVGAAPATVSTASRTTAPQEVLVIASRLKDYIQSHGDMNTSASVMDVLSAHLRILCEHAMDNARADGRKTVMDRDFDFLKK